MRIFNKDPKIALPDYDTAPGYKIFSNLLFGESLNCFNNMKKTRQSVIKKLKVGDPVALEPCKTSYGKTFMAIDAQTGLDIGEVSPGTYEYIQEKFRPNTKFVGRVRDVYKKNGVFRVEIEYRAYW